MYHKVVVDLVTHSVGAISNFDVELARMMKTLANQDQPHEAQMPASARRALAAQPPR